MNNDDVMPAKQIFFYLLSFLFCFNQAKAQNFSSDSSLQYSSNAVVNYIGSRDKNLLLYNGVEYAHSYPGTSGFPFFLTDNFQRSSLRYDGVWYEDVPLAYDIVNNSVVIKNKDSFLIELVPGKVASFLFQDHQFISLTASAINNSIMPAGIYEAYDYGAVTVFIHHQKIVQRAANAADPDHFSEYDTYFIKKENDYFSIKSSNDFLTVFAPQSDEIKTFLHENKKSFKKDPESTVLKAAAYYAQIKK